jgi:hypothetical protein
MPVTRELSDVQKFFASFEGKADAGKAGSIG